jgi:hypothetical protein
LAIAACGLRISLGPWHSAADLQALVQALKMALAAAGNQYPAASAGCCAVHQMCKRFSRNTSNQAEKSTGEIAAEPHN